MAKSFFKLDTRRALKDNTYPIVLCVGYGKNMYITTGISAAADDWDKVAQMYTGKNAKSVNSVLRTIMATTTTRILELREDGIFDKLDNKQLKTMLQNPDAATPPAPDRHTVGDMFRTVMGMKSSRTGEIYASTVTRLRLYCDIDSLRFEDINRMWLDGFMASMRDLSPNTQAIHLRNLRAVNNYAIDCDITQNYPFRRYKLPKQTTRKRAFSVDVLRNLATLPIGHNAIYRDLFMLTFYLCGINFVDLCGLTCIKDGRVEYMRAKTHKPYSIKVEPEAMAIIDRLRGTTHLLYMLDRHKTYRSYYRQLRRGLDAVRKAYNERYPDAPIDELSTYWARHSWATVARSAGVSVDDIALALGHGDGHDITHIYIDDDLSNIDRANRKVIDYVLHDMV